MPELKLTYFDFDGGRAEPVRIALSTGNIPFEDIRFAMSEWPEYRDRAPLQQVPVMEIDGALVTQTNAMLRYAGKMTGLYPQDPLEALHCDEAMTMVEDMYHKIGPTMFMEDEEEKRLAREALASGPISLCLGRFETMLKQRGGNYFAGNKFSVADLKVFLWVRNLKAGTLDYIDTDIVETVAPELAKHFERISAEPCVVAYYEKRAG
jgi:glutathione S-transferase